MSVNQKQTQFIGEAFFGLTLSLVTGVVVSMLLSVLVMLLPAT